MEKGVKTIYYVRSQSLEIKNANPAPPDRLKKRKEKHMELKKKALFNAQGDTEIQKRRIIGGNTTNLNDFNNMKYTWVSSWYRQAMNNFWIPEEINLTQDTKDYRLLKEERELPTIKFCPFSSSSTPFRRQTFPTSANTSLPMRLISA